MMEVFTRLFDSLKKTHQDSFLDEAIPKISPKEGEERPRQRWDIYRKRLRERTGCIWGTLHKRGLLEQSAAGCARRDGKERWTTARSWKVSCMLPMHLYFVLTNLGKLDRKTWNINRIEVRQNGRRGILICRLDDMGLKREKERLG